MRRKFLLILFGALALVQLRTLKVTQVWMYAIPLIPLLFDQRSQYRLTEATPVETC